MVIERAMGMVMVIGMGIADMVMDTVPRSVTARPATPTPLTITTSATATTIRGAARSTVDATGTAIGAAANELQGGWQERILGYFELMFFLMFRPPHIIFQT